MLNTMKRRNVDLLNEQFWRQGYSTISRKYGKYLPEPSMIGNYEIDIIARYKKDYAIGITLSKEELNDSKTIEKINFLATRKTKYTNKKVMLFVGIPAGDIKIARKIIGLFDMEIRKNIKLFPIIERPVIVRRPTRNFQKTLFS